MSDFVATFTYEDETYDIDRLENTDETLFEVSFTSNPEIEAIDGQPLVAGSVRDAQRMAHLVIDAWLNAKAEPEVQHVNATISTPPYSRIASYLHDSVRRSLEQAAIEGERRVNAVPATPGTLLQQNFERALRVFLNAVTDIDMAAADSETALRIPHRNEPNNPVSIMVSPGERMEVKHFRELKAAWERLNAARAEYTIPTQTQTQTPGALAELLAHCNVMVRVLTDPDMLQADDDATLRIEKYAGRHVGLYTTAGGNLLTKQHFMKLRDLLAAFNRGAAGTPSAVRDEALRIYRTSGKIEAIKWLRNRENLGLKEAKDQIEAWVDNANNVPF